MANQDWKKKNYNMGIRVSEQTVQKLRAGKTFEKNVAAYKKSGGDKQTLEAMNRFYGKQRVSSALGNSLAKTSVGKAKPPTAQHSKTGNTPPKANPTTLKTPTAPKPSGPGFGTSAGNFIKNELLGVDDFSKTRQQFNKRQYGAMAKSWLAGSLELGTTVAAIAAAPFSGGASLGAKAAQIAAKQGAKATAKQVAKQAIRSSVKQTMKTATIKGVAKSAVKSVATGSVKKGASNVIKVVGARPKPIGTVVSKGKIVVGKQAEKYLATSARKQAIKTGALATERATKATKNAEDALKAQKTAKKTYESIKASRPMTKAGKPSARMAKGEAAAKKAYESSKAATATANKGARIANTRATKAVADATAREAAKKAAKKSARKVAKRGAIGHVAAHYGTEGWYSSDKKKAKK